MVKKMHSVPENFLTGLSKIGFDESKLKCPSCFLILSKWKRYGGRPLIHLCDSNVLMLDPYKISFPWLVSRYISLSSLRDVKLISI